MNRYYKENQKKFIKCFLSGLLIKDCRIISKRLEIETITWEEYWFDFELDFYSETYFLFKNAFEKLYTSKFDKANIYVFCKTYYSLLKEIFEREDVSDERRLEALQTLISFGNFPILNKNDDTLAAVTFNLYNPNYLISKINSNNSLEDAKYLSLVTLKKCTGASSLFFHYRQIPLKFISEARLFFYIPEESSLRLEAFIEIKKVIDSLYYKPDTLLNTRANYLAERIVYPILKKILKKHNTPIRILDLGGGSGLLTAKIIERISKLHPDLLQDDSIEWYLLDGTDFTSSTIFNRKIICRKILKFQYIQSDFRTWALENSSNIKKYDLIFCFRIINTASLVSIEKTSDDLIIKKMLPVDFCKTARFLDLTGYSLIDNHHLIVSKSRVRLQGGYTYKQISNTQYYRTLYCLKHQTIFPSSEIYYPFRKVNLNELFGTSKKSLLEVLCKIGNYVIIEDVDLDYRDLLEHFHQFNLNLVVRDLTTTLKLTSSHLFCISETFS